MQKSKKPRENQKKQKKQKKTIFQDSWKRKNAKIKKTSRKPKKNKKKKQYSRTLVCRPHLQTSGILVFLVFSRFFGFLHFYFCKSPGILFFLVFFGFLEVFLIFGFLLLQESWHIVFFLVFWFSRGFLVFFL